MTHYLLNFSTGDQDEAVARLRAQMWGIAEEESDRDALAPGDLALIYVPHPDGFVGRADLATAVRPWTAAEAAAYPGESPSGVQLSDVERWDRAVPMATVVARVDPTASNPLVQANMKAGFSRGVVRITADEYEAALTACREYQGS